MNLESVMYSSKCYGCGACVNICDFDAVTMIQNEKGFQYPQVDAEKCKQCNKCYSVCPAVSENRTRLTNENKFSEVFSVRYKEVNVRKKSSSGGLFTALSNYILSQGGVICGVVWGENFTVKHICTSETKIREDMVQSKYIQSDLHMCFREVRQHLNNGKKVLFTGTPCQVAGLRLYLGEAKTDNLFLCDVLCGGNVSPGLFRDYIVYIEKIKNDVADAVCFRTKKYGWKQHHICVNLQNSIYEGARRDNEPFFSLYIGKYSIRDSCFLCGFASVNRISDITLGDFWGLDKVDNCIDDDTGISLAIVNTEKGSGLLRKISNDVFMERRDIDLAIPRQINLKNPPAEPKKRKQFWDDYVNKGGEYTLKKYTTFGLYRKLRSKIGRLLRRRG